MDALERRKIALKKLHTREMKIRRQRVKKEFNAISPICLRLRNSDSPLNIEINTEQCFIDESVCLSSGSNYPAVSPSSCSSYKLSSQINSLPSLPLTIQLPSESHETFSFTTPLNSVKQCDEPLDMSKKRHKETVSTESQISHLKQLRPSVITCASALLRTPCNQATDTHMCTISVKNTNSYVPEVKFDNQEQKKVSSTDSKDFHTNHRREIVSVGSYDPVVDEHFRRSLGRDYQHLFSKPSNNVSLTVDDHFAKALGETWRQIQQSKDPTLPSHSSNSLQNSQKSPFLSQPPEITS